MREMTDTTAHGPSIREPLQARSAATLARTLEAAEALALEVGLEKMTIAAVADRAGISVGSVYRRFEGKAQLVSTLTGRMLDQRRDQVAARLRDAGPSLADVLTRYAHALMEAFADSHALFPDLLTVREADAEDHGARTISEIRGILRDAAAPHAHEIRRSDATGALDAVAGTVLAACFHSFVRPDALLPHMTRDGFAQEISAMAIAYLRTPDGFS
jgi:AcrR family transcriptional regulator